MTEQDTLTHTESTLRLADALAFEIDDLYGVGVLEKPDTDDDEDPRWPLWRAFRAYRDARA